MDLMTSNTINTNTSSCVGTKVEAEVTPSPRIMRTASLLYTNGVLKHHKTTAPQHESVLLSCGGGGGVIYKECLKNHAANMGGHALDGCGEFMPAQTATATDPRSLKCAACGCHRNFHRLERVPVPSLPGTGLSPRVMEYHPQNRHLPLPPPPPPPVRTPDSDNDDSPPPISSSYNYHSSAPHMLLTLSSGGDTTPTPIQAAPTPTHTHTHTHTQTTIVASNEKDACQIIPDQIFGSRKRFRTKFSQEQKDRMAEFAEKVGWKMQKSNSELINGFCEEVGVHREVFKVWMHNNKNTLGKRSGCVDANAAANANYVISPNLNHNLNGNGVGNSNSSGISHNNNQHHLINNASSSSS